MAANNILLNILAQTKDAQKSIDDFRNTSSKSLAAIEKGFGFLKLAAAAAVAVVASQKLIQGMQAAINAAAEQEQAIQNLNTALALSGDYTAQASEEFQNFAGQMQKTTKFSDDAILNQVALAKSFGTTNEQAKKLVKAAADLSTATGVSLDSAVEQLGKTLQGTSGALGKTIPGLKGLSAEALKSGAAIDLIAKRFGGAAESGIQTFDGSLAKLNNTWGDFLEEVGNVIVKNPVVVAAIGTLSKVIELATNALIASGPAIKDFIGAAIKLGFNVIPFVIDVVEILGKTVLFLREILLKAGLAVVSLISGLLEFGVVQKLMSFYIDAIAQELTFLVAVISGTLEAFAKFTGTEKYLQPIIDGIDDFGVKLASVNGDDAVAGIRSGLESVGTSLAEGIGQSDAMFKSFGDGAQNARKFADGLAQSIQGVNANAAASTKTLEQLNANAQASKPAGPATIGSAVDGSVAAIKAVLDPAKVTQAFSGALTNLKPENLKATFGQVFSKDAFKGAIDGIRNVKLEDVGSALSTAGSSIASGIGTAAKGFAGIFGGDFVNMFSGIIGQIGNMPAMLKAAFDNLDGILNGLLESLPGVISSLLDAIPKVAESFAKKFPELVNILVEAFPKIADALLAALPKVLQAILDAIPKIIAMIPVIVDKLAKAIPGLIRQILQALPAIITAIARAIPQIVKSIAAAIPEIIVVIAENLAPIILALVQGILEAIPAIILALVDVFIVKGGLIKIIFAIIQAIPQICIALVQGIVRAAVNSTGELIKFLGTGLGKMFSGAIKLPAFDLGKAKDALSGKLLFEKLKELFEKYKDYLTGKAFMDKLKEGFNKLLDKLKDILTLGIGGGGGGGGKKGPVTGISGSPLAEGGIVPKGFPNDTFPARLSSNELILPPAPASELISMIKAFRSGQLGGGGGSGDTAQIMSIIKRLEASSEKNVTVNIQVGPEQLAKVMLNLNRQGFRVA